MKVYYSRIDRWIAALLAGSILFCLGTGFFLLGSDRSAALIIFGIDACSVIFILFLAVPCKKNLFVECYPVQTGMIKYAIPYSEIRKIEKWSNSLSSQALSLRCVKNTRKKVFCPSLRRTETSLSAILLPSLNNTP